MNKTIENIQEQIERLKYQAGVYDMYLMVGELMMEKIKRDGVIELHDIIPLLEYAKKTVIEKYI